MDEPMKLAKENMDKLLVEVYKDGLSPTVKAVGSIVALPFQAIDVALSKAKLWVDERQYNYDRTRELLAEKLKSTPSNMIEPPEPFIAVPALQNISYCMDNDELREMYANLLANSMIRIVKNGVHPGFVDIIKQLCPDEAKILKYVSSNETVPVITLRYTNEKHEGIDIVKNFSNIGEVSNCENPYDVNIYFDNLIRLGLLEHSKAFSTLIDKTLYEPLKTHHYILPRAEESVVKKAGFINADFVEEYLQITDFGKAFCKICLSTTKMIVMDQQ